jgi:hypothetical protein
MGNIASTVYTKTAGSVDLSKCLMSHHTLIEALWALFMYSKSGPVTTSGGPVLTGTTAPEEPYTPESLAVMVHLAVKSFCVETVTSLGVCNDIRKMYNSPCHEESQFIPITAIVGGLFGVNVEVNVDGFNYYITNKHYRGMWAPGSICYNKGVWHVMGKDLPLAMLIPHETPTSYCYHTGTLGAYVRLNNLKVVTVPSDNYCGFHTVAALVGLFRDNDNEKGYCDLRKTMVSETSEYMIRNKNDPGIAVYLEMNKCTSHQRLTDYLMQRNRWLSVDEVTFMLMAYKKLPVVITEHSYPIYELGCAHVLIKGNHYEPVVHV